MEIGGQYGLGHGMRSAVLIHALKVAGAELAIAVRLGDGALPDWILPSAADFTLEGDGGQAELQAEAVARQLHPDWVVVDGYGLLGTDLIKRLRAADMLVAAFDDIGDEGGGANLVINQNRAGSDACDVSTGQLFGARYALVDPDYAMLRSRRPGKSIDRILVTFGGSDRYQLTGRTLAALAALPGEKTIDVVVGPYHEIRIFPKPGRHCLNVHQQPHGLAALLKEADLVISAAGTTCWQVCCAGAPLVAVQTVDNQREVVHNLEESRCALTFSREAFVNLLDEGKIIGALQPLQDISARCAMVAAQHQLVDGNGAMRVLAAMGI